MLLKFPVFFISCEVLDPFNSLMIPASYTVCFLVYFPIKFQTSIPSGSTPTTPPAPLLARFDSFKLLGFPHFLQGSIFLQFFNVVTWFYLSFYLHFYSFICILGISSFIQYLRGPSSLQILYGSHQQETDWVVIRESFHAQMLSKSCEAFSKISKHNLSWSTIILPHKISSPQHH